MCVTQVSLLMACSVIYENQQYINLGIILFMSNKVYVPHLSTVGGGGIKCMISPWYHVLSTLFMLTYHLCIRSSLHINCTSLAIISPISNENFASITYVTLKAPELYSERTDLQLLRNKLEILYYQEMQKK